MRNYIPKSLRFKITVEICVRIEFRDVSRVTDEIVVEICVRIEFRDVSKVTVEICVRIGFRDVSKVSLAGKILVVYRIDQQQKTSF